MEESDISEVLQIILKKIHGKNILWRLEGSGNLRVQGVPTMVRDLDIATTKEGIAIFRESLKEYLVEDSYREDISSEALLLHIRGFEIEILNRNPDRMRLNMFDCIEKIRWRKLTLPILPLSRAIEFYQKIQRDEKVKILKDFLKKSKLG